jgi:hypothetical protein
MVRSTSLVFVCVLLGACAGPAAVNVPVARMPVEEIRPEAAEEVAEDEDEDEGEVAERRHGRTVAVDPPAWSPAGEVDVWGGLEGVAVGDAYGKGELGRPWGCVPRAEDDQGPPSYVRHGRASVVKVRGVVIEGSLARDVVTRLLAGQVGLIKRCHVLLMEDDPAVVGRVRVRFEANTGGGVSDVEVVEAEPGGMVLERCVFESMHELKFPPRDGYTRISAEFTLSTGSPPRAPRRSVKARCR